MRERLTVMGAHRRPAPRVAPVLRALAMFAFAAVMVGCGSSRVIQGGGGYPGGYQRSKPPVKVSTPKYGASYVVRRGETLYRIATNNGITALDLALWNNISPPYTIHPGQRLKLYPGGPTYPRTVVARPPSASGKPVAPRAAPATPIAAVASNLTWRWPADGSLVARFVSGDPTKQGIDIAGSAGNPVRAAADGVVVYSGSGLVGYGELIIVKHNEQWLSAYGHNRARLVNEGGVVKAGQQIAEMGRTGAARDMLHFEIRYNGKPVDPLGHLPRR